MRDGLVRALESHTSIRVVGAAATSVEAVAVVSKRRPALALLDMSMASCLETLSALRKASSQLCVVAFSAGDNGDDLLACIELGVVGFVPRRGTIDDIVAACEGAIRGEVHCCPYIAAVLFRRLASPAPAGRSWSAPVLSPREIEIIDLIDRGFSNKAIGQILSIELSTVKNHVHSILKKLHVATRGEATAVLRRTSPGARHDFEKYAQGVSAKSAIGVRL
jgi:DNA-binding NarL/FixJ family response regulator